MYKPQRDYRFEYVTSAIENIEQNSCVKGCAQAISATEEWPGNGCFLLSLVMMEVPLEEIDDRGDEGLFCTVREPLGELS